MEITHSTHGNIHVVVPSGRLQGDGADKLRVALFHLINQGSCYIVLDLTHVTYIDAAGFRVLREARISACAEGICGSGGDLILAGLQALVQELFSLRGELKNFHIYQDVTRSLIAANVRVLTATDLVNPDLLGNLEDELDQLFEQNHFRVVLDLTAVTDVSNAGFGVLIKARAEARRGRTPEGTLGDIHIVASHQVQQQFVDRNYVRMFKIFTDLASAIGSF